MNITPLDLPGVCFIEPKVWGDPRGYFLETFHAGKYAAAGIRLPLVQANHSHSSRGVLRGLHHQTEKPQGKLIYVVRGAIWDVAVDVRRGSPAFGKWMGRELNDQNKAQMYVPPGCLHGFVALSQEVDVIYQCTDVYHPQGELGVIWNDPQLAVAWPMAAPQLSAKDAVLPRLADLPIERLPVYEPPAG